jgi:hypothetical protein
MGLSGRLAFRTVNDLSMTNVRPRVLASQIQPADLVVEAGAPGSSLARVRSILA